MAIAVDADVPQPYVIARHSRLRQEFRGAMVVLGSEGRFARDEQNGNATKIDELARRLRLRPAPLKSPRRVRKLGR